VNGVYLAPGHFPAELLRGTVEFLLRMQRPSGEIPWFAGGKTDPWDHVEAAMGLSIGGELQAAQAAYDWLARNQLDDGSWWAGYRGDAADHEPRRETNFVAYVATGVWHHYLISRDRDFLLQMWPTVAQATDFVLAQQTPHGDIHWAVDAGGKAMEDALITGCSSIYKSLECAHNIAVTLGTPQPQWQAARHALGTALRQHPERFDRTWASKSRYAMDWFYPVLTGVVVGKAARNRLAGRWDAFVEDGLGCRCVVEEPWVTVAESCELVLALLAAGERSKATRVFSWLHRWRHSDGSYWTGYQFALDLLWPDERPTWTAAAILLAADALTGHTAASQLFQHVNLLLSESAQTRA
jgi:hypothetical protein